MAQIRFCFPCKIQTGENVPAGTNSKGVPNSARRRVAGVIKPVCDRHAVSLDVIRAEVAGVSDKSAEMGRRTTVARQSAETALTERVADVVADSARLDAAQRWAVQFLTVDILRSFERAAGRRCFVQSERDAARDEMVDRFVEYVAARVIRFEPVNVPKIVGAVCALNTSERAARRMVRLDADVVTSGAGSLLMASGADVPTVGACLTLVQIDSDDYGHDVQRDLLRDALAEMGPEATEILLAAFVDGADVDPDDLADALSDARAYCGA